MEAFSKAVIFTDQHFGRRSGHPEANQDNLDFIDWFIEEARIWGADTCIMMGDYFDNRSSLKVDTLHAGIEGMNRLSRAFKKIYTIVGNHDLFYRTKRDITSMRFAQYIPNVIPVFNPMTIGEGKHAITLLPWMTEEDRPFVKTIRSRYVFGHLELNGGWYMNAKAVVPDREDALSFEDFPSTEYVFSGHYHFRQAKDNVVYTGNPFPFDFADAWDEDRGMMFLEWGKEPVFKAWPDQPLFRTFSLSDLLENPDRVLKSKLTAKCQLNIDINYEESQLIRDNFVKKYGLRKLELVPMPKTSVAQQTFVGDVEVQTIDQIVFDGLDNIESETLDKDVLKDIYRSL